MKRNFKQDKILGIHRVIHTNWEIRLSKSFQSEIGVSNQMFTRNDSPQNSGKVSLHPLYD